MADFKNWKLSSRIFMVSPGGGIEPKLEVLHQGIGKPLYTILEKKKEYAARKSFDSTSSGERATALERTSMAKSNLSNGKESAKLFQKNGFREKSMALFKQFNAFRRNGH